MISAILGQAAKSRAQRILVGITAALGVLGAAGVVHDHGTFAEVAKSVQSLMSITLPFTGVLLARRTPRARLWAMWVVAALVAVAAGIFGVLVSVVAVAFTAAGGWDHAATVAVYGVLVQVVAQFVGTGLGLLLPAVVACVASIVLPLGLWLAVGRSVGAWITPYGSDQSLFSGTMTGLDWIRWTVVVLIWCVLLNAAGALRVTRRETARS